jgi:flagellar biosynthesis protein FlhG
VDQAQVLREIKKTESGMFTTNSTAEREDRYSNTRVVAITSGKGGVGKTNVAANIAYILTARGKKVLLLDADAGLANVDVILGITPQYNLCHVLQGERTLAETIVRGPGGIMILPAASGIQEMTELSRGHKLTLLDTLGDLDEEIDFMFIDTGAGIAGNVMYFNMCAKEIIVVVSPEPTSLTDAYALIKILYQNQAARRFMILVNMVKDSNEARRVHRRLSNAVDHFLNLSIEYLGFIPFDENVRRAVKEQRVLVELFPSSKASRQIVAIADRLYRETTVESENGAIKFFNKTIIGRNDG